MATTISCDRCRETVGRHRHVTVEFALDTDIRDLASSRHSKTFDLCVDCSDFVRSEITGESPP